MPSVSTPPPHIPKTVGLSIPSARETQICLSIPPPKPANLPREAPEIPTQTFSKGSNKRKASTDLRGEQQKLVTQIREARRKLKAHGSFDYDYWVNRTNVASMQVEHTKVQRKLPIRVFARTCGGKEQDSLKTTEARKLLEEKRAHALDQRICATQVKRLKVEPGDKLKTMHRTFMQLFTCSKIGLNISTGMGRQTRDQSNFRDGLIRLSNAEHPDPKTDMLWCPISDGWVFKEEMTATHIFSYCHGQSMMDAILGRLNADEPELFSSKNRLFMSTGAEALWDKGYFVIVPLVDDDASHEVVLAWHKELPKRYNIRVMDPKAQLMDKLITYTSDRVWNQLDGQKIIFEVTSAHERDTCTLSTA